MKGLDIAKLEKEKNFIIVSSEDALRDVEPMIDNDKDDIKNRLTDEEYKYVLKVCEEEFKKFRDEYGLGHIII